MSEEQILQASKTVADKCVQLKRSPNVEEIQDMVETEIMARGFSRSLTTTSRIVMSAPLSEKPIRPTSRSCPFLSGTTKKSSKKTRTRIRLSTACSAIIWPARSQKTSQNVSYCRKKSWKRTTKGSFTSTIRTISPSICTIAVWSI